MWSACSKRATTLQTDINAREPIPRHQQLRENLLDLIDTELEPDNPIPSERDLGECYALSRMTAHQAINQLTDSTQCVTAARPAGAAGLFTKDATSQVLVSASRTPAFKRIAATPALAWQVKPAAALRGLHPDDGGNAPNLRCADGQGPGFHR